MSAHELNEICAFLLLTTFKVLYFSQLKYQQRLYSILQTTAWRRHVNFYHLP